MGKNTNKLALLAGLAGLAAYKWDDMFGKKKEGEKKEGEKKETKTPETATKAPPAILTPNYSGTAETETRGFTPEIHKATPVVTPSAVPGASRSTAGKAGDSRNTRTGAGAGEASAFQEETAKNSRNTRTGAGAGEADAWKQKKYEEFKKSFVPKPEDFAIESDTDIFSPGILAGGLKLTAAAAKKAANWSPKPKKLQEYTQELLPAPAKQLTYDKAAALAKQRAERAAARQAEMARENATRHGLDPDKLTTSPAADTVRKGLGGDEWTLGMKKGGVVKMKDGGSTDPVYEESWGKPPKNPDGGSAPAPKSKASAPVKKMASGGAVKGWGAARGGKACKVY